MYTKMDVFYFDNVKAEKANAIQRYRRLRTLTNLFRVVELCLALVFLSYLSSRLPFAVKLSGEYFRRLSSIIVKPVFVFVVSNLIILALLFKSGRNPAGDNAEAELYHEFVKTSDTRTDLRSENQNQDQPLVEVETETDEIVYQDKQIISEVVVTTTNSNTPPNNNTKCEKDDDENEELVMVVSNSDATTETTKNFRRTKSEKLRREKTVVGVLRRSETEMCRKNAIHGGGEEEEEELYGVDELSNEEFQRTIEAFIEKQMTFHLRERFAVVPHQNQN